MTTRSPRFLTLSLTLLVAAPLFLVACSSSSGSNGGTGGAIGTGGKTGSGGSGTGGAPVNGTGGMVAASSGGTSTGGSAGGATGLGGAGGGSSACKFAGGFVNSTTFPNGLTLTKACSPFHIQDVAGITIENGGVLTIEAGSTLMFDVNSKILVGSTGSGKLLANGTAQAPIVMTSVDMDQMAEGWYGLEFYAGTVTGSQVTYTNIEYAGGNFDGAIVGETGMPKNSATLDHVAVNKIVNDGVPPILVMDATSGFIIKTCTADGKPCPAP